MCSSGPNDFLGHAYEKPRVTTNSSHGEGELGGDGVSPLAVNEGVVLEPG